MKSTHVEVGKIIVRQMEVAANENQMGISVLSDDTDIFVLLLYEFLAQKLKLPLITEPPKTVPKLASLSPTAEALTEKIERAHYHACVWKHAQDSNLPGMSLSNFGWLFKEAYQSLSPVTVPCGISLGSMAAIFYNESIQNLNFYTS